MKWFPKRRMRTPWSADRPGIGPRSGPAEIAAELSRRGVPAPSCDVLASALVLRMASLPKEGREGLLDGVAMAFEFQEGTQLHLLRRLREVEEVEKMMGAFSGELSKLDEVLEVLATYVQRMRGSGSSAEDRRLH